MDAEETRLGRLVAAVSWFTELAEEARTAGSFGAAEKAKSSALRVQSEIDQLKAAAVANDVPESLEEQADLVLSNCRRLGAAAQAGQSFIAARDLLKLEAELVAAQIARRDAAEKPDDRDVAELLAATAKVMDRIPEAVKARVQGD